MVKYKKKSLVTNSFLIPMPNLDRVLFSRITMTRNTGARRWKSLRVAMVSSHFLGQRKAQIWTSLLRSNQGQHRKTNISPDQQKGIERCNFETMATIESPIYFKLFDSIPRRLAALHAAKGEHTKYWPFSFAIFFFVILFWSKKYSIIFFNHCSLINWVKINKQRGNEKNGDSNENEIVLNECSLTWRKIMHNTICTPTAKQKIKLLSTLTKWATKIFELWLNFSKNFFNSSK